MGQDQDDVVIIPLTTAQERLIELPMLSRLIFQEDVDAEKMDQVQAEVELLLRSTTRLRVLRKMISHGA